MTTSASARCWFLRGGSRHIPRDAVRAAVGRTTIRHRSAPAHRYVLGLKGCFGCRLPGEIAVMDTRPSRTQAVLQTLGRAAVLADGRCAVVTRGAFKEGTQRDDRHRIEGLRRSDVKRIPVSPKPITVDGKPLDPIEHVQAQRERELIAMKALPLSAQASLQLALPAVPDGVGRWQTKAVCLNAAEIGTVRDRVWTAENVCKLSGQLAPGEVRA